MNLSPYPEFRPIEVADKPDFDEALKKFPPKISEATFTNIYAWRQIYKFSAATMDGFIILRSDQTNQPRFFNPIGRGDVKSAIMKILDEAGGSFIRLPEETKAFFEPETIGRGSLGIPCQGFEIMPDPDNSDYLYKTSDLIKLDGKKYDGKRNLIKKFKSEHKYEYAALNSSNVNKALDFEDAWCSIKDCDSVECLYHEREALREIVANFANFNLSGGAIIVEGMIRAVAISERLNNNTMVMHILKADPNVAGLYQVMMNDFLAREGKGFEFVNLEQDLGVEGLRKSKLSYHPVEMIRKYTLTKCKR